MTLQATPLPLRNNSSQYQARTMPVAEARLLQRESGYRQFLTRVRGDMERCLLQNTIIDVCADDFARMQEEEALKGTRSDKPINEVMSCMDIRHCRDMRVSQLRWHPQLQRLNAVRAPMLVHGAHAPGAHGAHAGACTCTVWQATPAASCVGNAG